MESWNRVSLVHSLPVSAQEFWQWLYPSITADSARMPLLHDLSTQPSDKKAGILLSLVPGHSTTPGGSLNSVHTAVNGSFIKYTQGNGTVGNNSTPWHQAYSNYGVLGMGWSTVRRKDLENHWIAVAMINGLSALEKRSFVS